MKKSELIKKQISQLLADFPFLQAFFNDNNLEIEGKEALTLPQYFDTFDEDEIEDRAIDAENLISQIGEFIEQMIAFLGKDEDVVKTVSILPGTDKSGNAEKFDELVIKQGEIISIVGPTGSGKSRLLGDIEWVAQNDTPTSRKILINNDIPDKKW